jgi:phosphomannomutase
VALCEAAAHLDERGSSLAEQLEQLYARYGRPEYRSGYFIADAPAKSRAVFDRLRATPPTEIAGMKVDWVRDLGTGLDTSRPDGRAVLPWRQGDMMITYGLAGGAAVLTLRASGTEPKLKWYLEVILPSISQSAWDNMGSGEACDRMSPALVAALVTAVDVQLMCVDEAGLKRPTNIAA